MKKYFLSIVCLCAGIALMSCSKDDDDATNAILSINATVENGSSYNSSIDNVKAIANADRVSGHWEGYAMASSEYKDGKFTISLPETVDNKYLFVPEFASGVTVSDPNVKVCGIDNIVAYKSGVQVGEFKYATQIDLPWTGTSASYTYATGDVKITGSISFGDDADKMVFNYNFTLKKGWNITYTAMSKSSTTITMTTTNTAPSGLKWYLTDL